VSGRPRLVIATPWDTGPLWRRELSAALPELDAHLWPDLDEPARVIAAAVWQPPADLFAALPDLRVIQSLGAGVDHLWRLGAALPDVPVLRLVDPAMTARLAQYVLAGVLAFERQLDLYRRQQAGRRWVRHAHRDPGEAVIGVLGLGVMGSAIATTLRRHGFRVLGWRATPVPVDGVEVLTGAAGLIGLAGRAHGLVCALPATPATDGILHAGLFRAMRAGSWLINVGRGSHVVEPDLLAALDRGRPAAALLDVVAREPLAADDPLWRHPAVTLTPHVAALSSPATAATAIAAGIRAVLRGERPPGLADRARGY
jgi:glyoxylate/hydroxypyruvate reductase A